MYSALLSPLSNGVDSMKRGTLYRAPIQAASTTPGVVRQRREDECHQAAICVGMNNGIDPQLCSLTYTSVDKVARMAQSLGPGTLMAKLDIKAAYCLVPVHPDDRHILGLEWRGRHYIDGMLPFGLRSAPKIFTAVTDTLESIIRRRGVRYVDHYLDDFIVLGPKGTPVCSQVLDMVLQACADLGVPLAMDKLPSVHRCWTWSSRHAQT